MFIIGQDKKQVINIENISGIFCKKSECDVINKNGEAVNFCIQVMDNEIIYHLGYYSTIERAQQILKEIIDYYDILKRKSIYAMGDSEFTFDEVFYYQLPEE